MVIVTKMRDVNATEDYCTECSEEPAIMFELCAICLYSTYIPQLSSSLHLVFLSFLWDFSFVWFRTCGDTAHCYDPGAPEGFWSCCVGFSFCTSSETQEG
jgi:hypothetical protein